MNCHEVKSRLGRYLDSELSPRENLLVEEHIGRCVVCTEELNELTRIDSLLRSVVTPPVPKGLTYRIRAAPGRPGASSSRFAWSFETGIGSISLMRPAGIAAVLAVVLALLTGWALGRGTAVSAHRRSPTRATLSEGTEWFSAMPPGSMPERYVSLTEPETTAGRNP